MKPSRNQAIPHPGMVFFSGRWMPPGKVANYRVIQKRAHDKYYATEHGREARRHEKAEWFQRRKYHIYIRRNNREMAVIAARLEELDGSDTEA